MQTAHAMLNSQRLEEFPITRSKVFLAHAASSPLPKRVITAVNDYVSLAGEQGQWSYIYKGAESSARRNAAKLLSCREDEIAFVGSTSTGLSMVAEGLSWNEGDNVVVFDGDFPSNIYPWLHLKRKGVETRFIPRNQRGAVTVDDISRVIDNRTRLVSLSTVSFVTGYRIDEDEIGSFLESRGILFCLDAIQSLGAFPVSTRHVDFLASSAHKWLLGPLGTGILFVSSKRHHELQPALVGWKSVANCMDYLRYDMTFLDSALRYEPSTTCALGLVGFNAALELLLDYGPWYISARVSKLARALSEALPGKGYTVLSPDDPAHSSGIVSFCAPQADIAALRERLDSRGFVVSLRESMGGGKCIRVAPHFYNTEDEISRFLEEL